MSAEPDKPAPGRRRLAWPLLLLGLITVAVIIFILASPRRDMQDRDAAAGVVAGGAPEEPLRVTQARPLAGTNLVEIDIGAGGYRGGSYSSSGSSGEQRNILLLDRETGAVRRLLPDNSRIISQNWFLPAEANYVASSSDVAMPTAEDGPPPAYFVLLVAQGEHRHSFDLLIGSLAGPGQRVVMAGIAGVDALWMQSPTQIGLIVREGQILFYRIVDIPTLRVVRQHRVTIG